MLFWIIVAVLSLATGLMIALPLWRDPAKAAAPPEDMAIYRDQLAEVDRDLARGVLDAAEAERTRAEIARRLLAADRSSRGPATDAPRQLGQVLAGLIVISLVAGAGALYWQLGAIGYPDIPLAQRHAASDAARAARMSQAEAESLAPPSPPAELSAEYAALLDQLRTIVPTRPDEAAGWALLSQHEAQVGNYAAAAAAQARLIALRGAEATSDDRIALVDRMVAAVAGFVSPEAEAILREVLETDPGHLGALYYMGLLYAQTDRPDIAFPLWRAVIEAGASGTFYDALARRQIADVAFAAGVDYAPPPESPAEPGAESGPSAADIAAAQDMAPEDQQAMIEGMVSRLSDRLATAGGPASDWARLITALGVLGRPEDAEAIWAEAREVFANDSAALTILAEAATDAGVAP